MVVSYLFRTTGQVLGVSLSGALTQAILAKELGARITGEGAEEVSYLPMFNTKLADQSDYHVNPTIIHFDPALASSSPGSGYGVISESLTCRVCGRYCSISSGSISRPRDKGGRYGCGRKERCRR
jgi:hypothetical protein